MHFVGIFVVPRGLSTPTYLAIAAYFVAAALDARHASTHRGVTACDSMYGSHVRCVSSSSSPIVVVVVVAIALLFGHHVLPIQFVSAEASTTTPVVLGDVVGQGATIAQCSAALAQHQSQLSATQAAIHESTRRIHILKEELSHRVLQPCETDQHCLDNEHAIPVLEEQAEVSKQQVRELQAGLSASQGRLISLKARLSDLQAHSIQLLQQLTDAQAALDAVRPSSQGTEAELTALTQATEAQAKLMAELTANVTRLQQELHDAATISLVGAAVAGVHWVQHRILAPVWASAGSIASRSWKRYGQPLWTKHVQPIAEQHITPHWQALQQRIGLTRATSA